MGRVIEDEVTGLQMEVVDPDSEDDPLLTEEARAARVTASGATPAPVPTGTVVASQQAAPAPTETPATVVSPTEAAPPATAETVVEEETSDEETAAALGRLDNFLTEQVNAQVTAARKGLDQTITRLQKEHTEEIKTLRQELRETKLVGMEEDEKKVLLEKWAYDDRKAELDEYAKTLEGYDQDLMIASLVLKFGQYGVTEADLAEKSVAEMELACAETKAAYFEKLAQGGIHAAASQKPPVGAVPPVPAQPAPVVPAGLTAPSDVGSGTPAPQEQEFDKGQGREVMFKNLKNLPTETIQVRKA